MFVGLTKMFKDPLLNQHELLNEATVMLVSYCLLGLSDWIVDPRTKQEIGSWLMYITTINIVCNIILIVYKVVSIVIVKQKRKKN